MSQDHCKPEGGNGNGNGKNGKGEGDIENIKIETAPFDPRFPQRDQTTACFTYYCDYYRCMDILDGDARCEYLKKLFTCICPNEWIATWDERREKGNFQNPIYRVPKDYCVQEDLKRAQKGKKKD